MVINILGNRKCIEFNESHISFKECSVFTKEQEWNIVGDLSLRPMLNMEACLTFDNSEVGLFVCDGDFSQKWIMERDLHSGVTDFSVIGNLNEIDENTTSYSAPYYPMFNSTLNSTGHDSSSLWNWKIKLGVTIVRFLVVVVGCIAGCEYYKDHCIKGDYGN